jgi:microcystin-dependent protein
MLNKERQFRRIIIANYIKATNFAAKDSLPTGNSGKIIKGTEIDVEYTAIATAIASKADTNSPTFTGTPTAPTANAGTNNTQIATTAFVTASAASAIPSGVIVMWSGSIAAIPSGFYLCDGSNGTPNLRDRFVIGAGSSYAVGGTGGSKDAVVVSHSHTASSSVTDPGHVHGIDSRKDAAGNGAGEYINYLSDKVVNTKSATTGISVSTTVNSTGSSGTNANLPPYYALAYIMKA